MQNFKNVNLDAGLYFVATPIGNARDVSLRALDILASADVLVAEDTRSLRKLLDIHGVPVKGRFVMSYHDHSAQRDRERVFDAISKGQSVAYASEAGTPLIADPGYQLSRYAAEHNVPLTSAPGSSAVLCALTLAGLPTDSFFFAGFLPSASKARLTKLSEYQKVPATLVFYETSRRLLPALEDMCKTLGPDRPAALCRELTKKFEEVRRGTLDTLLQGAKENAARGECVLVVDRGDKEKIKESELQLALDTALQTMSLRDASETVSKAYGVPKREVYQMALARGKNAQK